MFCNEEFEKALAEIEHDTHLNRASSLCLSTASTGGTRRAAAARQGRLPRRRVLARAIKYILIWREIELCRVSSPGRRFTSSTRPRRRPPPAAQQDPPARPNANLSRVDANPRHALNMVLIAAACRISSSRFRLFLDAANTKKLNGSERLARPNSRTENQGGGFAKQ